MGQGDRPKNGPVKIDGATSSPSDAVQKAQQHIEQLPVVKPETGQVSDQKLTPESAQFIRQLPNAQLSKVVNVMRHMDVPTMQNFRLPGINRVVRDMRDAGKEIREGEPHKDQRVRHDPNRENVGAEKTESASASRVTDGRMEEARKKSFENYLGERKIPFTPKQVEAEVQRKQLSRFEDKIIERFEQGKIIEQETKPGEPKFLQKTLEQWKAFFGKFINRTVKKSTDLSEIAEFTYRGMVKKDASKAVVISDLIHNSGKTEKFVRFGVLYQKVGEFLQRLLPGDSIAKKIIQDGTLSEKLMYLALNPPSDEQDFLTGMKPKMGMFANQATEARVADELGIRNDYGAPDSSGILRSGKKKSSGKGIRGMRMFDKDEEGVDEQQGRFMPWWQWGDLKRPGGFTLKRAFYSGVFIAFVLVVLFLVHQFLLKK